MAAIARGDAEVFDGRGVNSSYRVDRLSVKVHHPVTSTELVETRIRLVDDALRGTRWYPPVLDLGRHGPSLVVVRPFAAGQAAEDGRRHLSELGGILRRLSSRSVSVAEDLIADYASPWLADPDRELARTLSVLTDHAALSQAVQTHLDGLIAAATRLSGVDAFVHHGDLHGRNLVFGDSGCTVIDWDESGFSRRPSDAAKALWLSCRHARGDFRLDPSALRRFLLASPCADPVDLARLGSLWFLPTQGHVTMLAQRDVTLVPWYLGWVSRFWARLSENLDIIAETASC